MEEGTGMGNGGNYSYDKGTHGVNHGDGDGIDVVSKF